MSNIFFRFVPIIFLPFLISSCGVTFPQPNSLISNDASTDGISSIFNSSSEMIDVLCDCCNSLFSVEPKYLDNYLKAPHICCDCNLKLVNDDSINYLFITDIHADNEEQAKATNSLLTNVVEYLNNYDGIDFLCIGGDLTSLYFENETEWTLWIEKLLSPLKKCKKPLFILNGNHDDNSNWNSSVNQDTAFIVSPKKFNEIVLNKFVNVDIMHDEDYYNSEYYYYDLCKNGTRYRIVCLDSNDCPEHRNNSWYWGFTERQIKWLKNVVFTDNNCKYVVLSHMSIEQRFNVCQTVVHYEKEVKDIIESFYNKYDLLVHSFGHLHLELLMKNDFGLPYSCTTTLFKGGVNSKFDGQQIYEELNDKSIEYETIDKTLIDYSYDLLSVNGLSVKRFAVGAGKNKEI